MKKGDVIIMPTETVYGLGAKLYDHEALDKIYTIKHRDPRKPIPVVISKLPEVMHIAKPGMMALLTMKHFWPGPLTVVLKASDEFVKQTGEKTVAVRCPNHPKALEILKENGPMWLTSLNLSGETPLFDIEVIKERYQDVVAEIHEQTEKQSHQPSTIIDMTKDVVVVIREGQIPKADIDAKLKPYYDEFMKRALSQR